MKITESNRAILNGIYYGGVHVGMIRPDRRIGLWVAATLWLIAHAVFHLWEVVVGICAPLVIPRSFLLSACRRSSRQSLPSGQSIIRAPREPHPPEITRGCYSN